MTEVLFYHLRNKPLERVLPTLLEKTLERGWRAVVQAASQETIEALDQLFWTYRDDSFLPHGRAEQGHGEMQPVVLTATCDNPNGAEVRFFVDGADGDDLTGLTRAVYLFDGHDENAVSMARAQWKRAADAGHDVTYWREDDRGRWVKQEAQSAHG